MRDLKYVIVDIGTYRVAILANGLLNHKDIAGNYKVLSAGFCNVFIHQQEISVNVWGKSETLNIKSKPGDKQIIIQTLTRTLYF